MSEFKTVEMTADAKGSPDGISVVRYKKGDICDLPNDLAAVFCNEMKCAKPARRKQESPESKADALETPEKPRKKRTVKKKPTTKK